MKDIIVPFYNHYNESENYTEFYLGQAFSQGIHTWGKKCLCEEPLVEKIGAVLVHGSRDINTPCYDKLIGQIKENPDKHFFLFAFSIDHPREGIEKVKKRIGDYPNYTSVTGLNLEECVERIERLVGLTKKE